MDVITTTSKIEERLVLNATQRNIPLGGAFELLPLCNMDCKMCFLRLTPAQMQSQGRMRTADEWLALASEAKDAGLLFLLLTGGEVFLYPEFERLYKGLYQMGFYITINSNGTLVNEHIAELLREYMPRRVNITLYGASDDAYAKLCGNPAGFTQVLNGIQLLLERKVPVKLNGSITAHNKDELVALYQIARKLQIPIEIDSYMFPAARKGICAFDYASRLTAEEAADVYLRVRKEDMGIHAYTRWLSNMAYAYEETAPVETTCRAVSEHINEEITCRAGKSSFWINWKGNMTPCVFMEEPAVSVFETGFADAWNSINKKRQQMFLPAACTKCQRRSFCTVCSACALTETGDPCKRPDYMCSITNEKLRLAHEQFPELQNLLMSEELEQKN